MQAVCVPSRLYHEQGYASIRDMQAQRALFESWRQSKGPILPHILAAWQVATAFGAACHSTPAASYMHNMLALAASKRCCKLGLQAAHASTNEEHALCPDPRMSFPVHPISAEDMCAVAGVPIVGPGILAACAEPQEARRSG